GGNAPVLQVVFEIAFAATGAADLEQPRGKMLRIELDELPPALPDSAVAAEELGHGIGATLLQAEGLEIEIQRTALRRPGVEVHHGQHDVRAVLSSLAVGDHLLIIDGVKPQALVAL